MFFYRCKKCRAELISADPKDTKRPCVKAAKTGCSGQMQLFRLFAADPSRTQPKEG